MAITYSPNIAMPTPFSNQTRNMPFDQAHASNISYRMPPKTMCKPKRPYTPYNLFYLLERELVVQKINGPPKNNGSQRVQAGTPPREEDQVKPSSRYDGIVMPPYWYDPNMKAKRKHRKTHGMISFKELTGIISGNWAKVDKETKDYVTIVSELGRKRYKEEMNRFNASQKAIELRTEQAKARTAKEMTNHPKKQPIATNTVPVGNPIATNTVPVGSPMGRNLATLNGRPIPVTPDRRMLNSPQIPHKPLPSVVGPHSYPHPNFPMMYPHRYGITQLPPPLPSTSTAPPQLPPQLPPPSTMSANIPPPYQYRPRQFQNSRPAKKSKKVKVEKDVAVSSNRDATPQHDEAARINSLMDHEFMNFEPDPITEDVFEEDSAHTFVRPAFERVEDADILDIIKGDVWNLDMDNFNYDEEPFTFLAD